MYFSLVLSALSGVFQQGVINFGTIEPTFAKCQDIPSEKNKEKTQIKKFREFLENRKLTMSEIKCTREENDYIEKPLLDHVSAYLNIPPI